MCNFYYVDLHLATQSSKGATTTKKVVRLLRMREKKKVNTIMCIRMLL